MDEKAKILDMLENGKITADQAERLLQAIDSTVKRSSDRNSTNGFRSEVRRANTTFAKNLKGKLRIEVMSAEGDDVKVTVPLKLAHLAVTMMPQQAAKQMEREGIDISSLLAGITDSIDEIDEDLVNVVSNDGTHVRIYIDR